MVCVINNSATLDGTLFTLHASQVQIDMPTLSEKDKEVGHLSVDAAILMCSESFLLYDYTSFMTWAFYTCLFSFFSFS